MDDRRLTEELRAFPGQEIGDLARLDALILAAVELPPDQDRDRALFSIFERFPDEDGYGVYWSIVHGLERRGHYAAGLLESVRRAPSHFALLMLNRMLNGGVGECAGAAISALFAEVADSPDVTPAVRQEAGEYRDRCRGSIPPWTSERGRLTKR